jgi:tetratricopeptide (TPR) repeat protein
MALLVLSGLPAAAQAPAGFTTNLDPLFQGVLAQPGNLGNTVQYAADAAQAGDIESAISAYDQLLFYNPNLSRTRFELGVLYYRLGSYEMARGYFKSALEKRDITPDLRERAEEYLAIINKKLFPDQFTGFAQTGLRYQTNAGAGPSPQTVLASGRTFNSNFFSQSDSNWFGAFAVNYVHDFETQDRNTFEASVIGYDAQQFRLHQFDIGLMEIRAGPRFGILYSGAGVSNLSIKPYAIATGALLADAPYYAGAGGGVTAHADIGTVALDPYVEIVQQSFRNSALYPLASGLGGTLSTYGLQAAGPLSAGLNWISRLSFAHANDNFNPYGYDSYTADIWLPWNFTVGTDSRTWTLTPTAGVSRWVYAAPDPTINPLVTPRSTEWRVGLGLDMPIWKQLVLSMLVQYRADVSNQPAFSMRDLTVSAGPTFRF